MFCSRTIPPFGIFGTSVYYLGKKKTSVSLDEETIAWIETKIGDKGFDSVSHAIEYAIEKLRSSEP